MNLQKRRRILLIAGLIYLLCACVLIGVRFYAIYTVVDPETGFFNQSAPWLDFAVLGFAAVSVLFLLVCLLFGVRFSTRAEKKDPDHPAITRLTEQTTGTRIVFSFDSMPRIFLSAFCGFSLITFSFLSLLELELQTSELFLQVFAIFAGLYLLLQYTPWFPLYSKRRTLLSLLPVLWSAFHLAAHFLSAARIATGEYHNWQMVMLAAVCVFFYLQTLFTTPSRTLYHFNLYYAMGLIGSALCMIFALPILILSNFWYYSAFLQYTNLYALMTLLTVALYLLTFSFCALSDLKRVQSEELLCSSPETAQDAEPIEANSTENGESN